MFAALLGLVFAVSAIPAWKRRCRSRIAGAGLAAIYLSQVRVSLVATVVMMGVYAFVVAPPGTRRRAPRSSASSPARIVVGELRRSRWRSAAPRSRDRVNDALRGDPISVYQGARGTQLTLTFFDLLFEYPLGAGLGRWGMAAGLLRTRRSPTTPTLGRDSVHRLDDRRRRAHDRAVLRRAGRDDAARSGGSRRRRSYPRLARLRRGHSRGQSRARRS